MPKITAKRGKNLRCNGWRQEALLRLLENVLENGEKQEDLLVYACLAKAARNWESYNAIVDSLKNLNDDETLIIQSGKPVGIFKTHTKAPIVLMANCNIVGQWANSETFYELQEKGLIIWGGLTAADWQYIGSQGVIQGTYEIFQSIARKHFNSDLRGKFILTAGLGGMGGAQPLAGTMANACILAVEVDEAKIDKRLQVGYLQKKTNSLNEALQIIQENVNSKTPVSVGLLGNVADIYPEILKRNVIPDILTDQTAAHDLLYGYVPSGYSLEDVENLRKTDPNKVINDAGTSIAGEVQVMLEFQKRGTIVFDNGNNIRTQAKKYGIQSAFDIPVFTEAFLRPLFCRGIGPFRWIALSGCENDIHVIDKFILKEFKDNQIITNWIRLARQIPFEGLPARIGWLGHGERTQLALAVNDMVKCGELKAPIAFTRDHLDAGAMTHPNIMTERMKDGSDAIADWPLLNALLNASSEADLVAIHSGGGGYAGYMTSAGVTLVADGTEEAHERLKLTLDNDTGIGILRYADAGYKEAINEAENKDIRHIKV